MLIEVMKTEDIDLVIPLYIDYYNNHEDSCWTELTAKKRIHQVLTIDNAYSLIMKDDDGTVLGFVMGYFKQYDDILGYTLEEIIIAYEYQNKGLGSKLLSALETKVKEIGASCIELQAVNDELHERYYGKAGYRDAKNFVMKVKWFE
ncbi:MAG: GNAT family N-acetyltransferase [Oscillospiraceae bacterium]|nr:GNAT family N-acetyltransferase [Oscillospiraceae bacterium]